MKAGNILVSAKDNIAVKYVYAYGQKRMDTHYLYNNYGCVQTKRGIAHKTTIV